jgi:hypothetical protein
VRDAVFEIIVAFALRHSVSVTEDAVNRIASLAQGTRDHKCAFTNALT